MLNQRRHMASRLELRRRLGSLLSSITARGRSIEREELTALLRKSDLRECQRDARSTRTIEDSPSHIASTINRMRVDAASLLDPVNSKSKLLLWRRDRAEVREQAREIVTDGEETQGGSQTTEAQNTRTTSAAQQRAQAPSTSVRGPVCYPPPVPVPTDARSERFLATPHGPIATPSAITMAS
jgi:hypothetical protein